jgi:hypothetical protein
MDSNGGGGGRVEDGNGEEERQSVVGRTAGVELLRSLIRGWSRMRDMLSASRFGISSSSWSSDLHLIHIHFHPYITPYEKTHSISAYPLQYN